MKAQATSFDRPKTLSCNQRLQNLNGVVRCCQMFAHLSFEVCLLKADCRGCETEAFRSGEQLLKAGAIQACGSWSTTWVMGSRMHDAVRCQYVCELSHYVLRSSTYYIWTVGLFLALGSWLPSGGADGVWQFNGVPSCPRNPAEHVAPSMAVMLGDDYRYDNLWQAGWNSLIVLVWVSFRTVKSVSKDIRVQGHARTNLNPQCLFTSFKVATRT